MFRTKFSEHYFLFHRKILYFACVDSEPVINRERLEQAVNLPTFCHKLPDHEFSKLEKTRNDMVKKMRDMERRRGRNSVLQRKEETEITLIKTESSESDSSRKRRSNTSQKSDKQEVIIVDSHSGKVL